MQPEGAVERQDLRRRDGQVARTSEVVVAAGWCTGTTVFKPSLPPYSTMLTTIPSFAPIGVAANAPSQIETELTETEAVGAERSDGGATDDTTADRLQELPPRPATGPDEVAETIGLRQQPARIGRGDIGIEHRHLLMPCGIRVRAWSW